MIQFETTTLLNVLAQLDHYEEMANSGTGCLDHDRTKWINEFLLTKIQPLCARYDLPQTRQQFNLFVSHTGRTSAIPRQVLKIKVIDLRRTLTAELSARLFLFLPEGQAHYFEKDDLFGKEFHAQAPSELNVEIKAAGNCLAATLYTAAVFHLMRVAEYGLRALAAHLGTKPASPLDYSEWGAVLGAIDKALEAQEQQNRALPRGPAKDDALQFTNGLRHSLTYFLAAYRNPVSHLRGNYNESDAVCAFNQVREFMQRMATRVTF